MDDNLYQRLLYDMTPATYYAFWDAVAKQLRATPFNVQANIAAEAIEAGLKTLPSKES